VAKLQGFSGLNEFEPLRKTVSQPNKNTDVSQISQS